MRTSCAAASVFLAVSCALGAGTPDARVDGIFAAYDKPDSPGCALGVIRDGEFVYRKGYGAGSLELGVPLTSQSVFYMGSVSKQFVAASVVLAAEQGLLSLDDNVRRYLPEIPDYDYPVTLRHMLHHTSGFRDILELMALSGRDAMDVHPTPELIDLIARQKALNFRPGDEYLYSNTNYFLLAEIVKRVTKKPFSAFAAEHIFQPLGMTHTRFYDDRTVVVPGRVAAYAPRKTGGFAVDWSTNFEMVGGGGLMSSVDDLLLWDRNFYRNQLGKGTLLKELQTHGVLNNGKEIAYALGLELSSWRGLPVVEHNGALFGYRTEILRFPEQRFTVLCLCNLPTAITPTLARGVAEVYLAKDLHADTDAKPVTAAVSRASEPGRRVTDPELAAYAGTYRSTELDATYVLSADDGGLMLRMNWSPPQHMTAAAQGDTFRGAGLTLAFQRDGNGGVKGIAVSGGRVRNVAFEKVSR